MSVGEGSKKASGAEKIITDGSHLENGELNPNIKYKAGEHGYSYETNSKGEITHASADDLKIKKHAGRLPHNPNTPNKLPGDHAGHIFGDRFGGSPELDNLVSQARKVNQSAYKKIENTWAKAIEQRKKVSVDIKINYETGTSRPTSFEVNYSIDGADYYERITNKQKEN
ncbi:DNA/RNA non-specific endonuclease [Bacillus aquiflavi]|uniref:DNA/RNA non-specific endonuclease n=1 Tax=Bacillus aquiflavi TaxID=2672567 RepID=UPI00223AA430|nr:DNA/RNA non-specific endonuclease [Bacillus aquiflavi]